jgi:AI-2 transport protein TqsA
MTSAVEREARIQTVSLLVLATIATATALYWLAPVLIPFVLALFLAVGLAPLIDLQIRTLKSPRPLAVLTTFLVGFLILYLLATLVAASVAQLSANAGAYQDQITRLWNRLLQTVPLQAFGIDPNDVTGSLPVDPGKVVGGTLVGLTKALVDLISKGFLVLVFLFFLLSGGGAARSMPGVWSEAVSKIQRYIVAKAAISAATGIAVGLVLAVLGIDLAMVFGLLAFLLNFIPSIGSIVATLLPLPVVIFNPAIGSTAALLAIAVPGAIQLVIGNVADPLIMGESLDIHPITVVLFLIFWGMIWGVVGMLLAAPIAAILKLLLERLELTAPLAHLMAGRLGAPEPAS